MNFPLLEFSLVVPFQPASITVTANIALNSTYICIRIIYEAKIELKLSIIELLNSGITCGYYSTITFCYGLAIELLYKFCVFSFSHSIPELSCGKFIAKHLHLCPNSFPPLPTFFFLFFRFNYL